MKIIPCGTPVVLLHGNIAGIISCVAIRYDTIVYEVTYLVDGNYNTVNVQECELYLESEKVPIGYK